MVDPATIVQTSKKWAGWGPLLAFSEIYFSESTDDCSGLGRCNDSLRGEGWYALEKSHGRWSRLLLDHTNWRVR